MQSMYHIDVFFQSWNGHDPAYLQSIFCEDRRQIANTHSNWAVVFPLKNAAGKRRKTRRQAC